MGFTGEAFSISESVYQLSQWVQWICHVRKFSLICLGEWVYEWADSGISVKSVESMNLFNQLFRWVRWGKSLSWVNELSESDDSVSSASSNESVKSVNFIWVRSFAADFKEYVKNNKYRYAITQNSNNY